MEASCNSLTTESVSLVSRKKNLGITHLCLLSGGEDYHTTNVQVQFVTEAIGDGVRASGLPDIINGYARTTEATIANLYPNMFNPNSTEYETSISLFNAYNYTLRTPIIPQWQVDRQGVIVVIEFYTTPDVRYA